MILSDLRDYLQAHGRASLADMATHFRTDPDALRGMLAKWVAKGRAEKMPAPLQCSGCCRCEPARSEIYQWTG